MENLKKHNVNIEGSKLVVAIAQLLGPLPDGKHKTVVNDRETFAWKSLETMNLRLEKVNGVLEQLMSLPLKPDVVVFPEYSFPIKQALTDLQRAADENGIIIVGGA